MFEFFKNKKPLKIAIEKLFTLLNENARNPKYFGENGILDDPDGRFEAVCLFCTSIFCGLANRGTDYRDLSQGLFDKVFMAFDQALRDLGVGDMAVAKRVRKLSESFYGRQKTYMDLVYATDPAGLAKMIGRNIFNRIDEAKTIDKELAVAAIDLYCLVKQTNIEYLQNARDLSRVNENDIEIQNGVK